MAMSCRLATETRPNDAYLFHEQCRCIRTLQGRRKLQRVTSPAIALRNGQAYSQLRCRSVEVRCIRWENTFNQDESTTLSWN